MSALIRAAIHESRTADALATARALRDAGECDELVLATLVAYGDDADRARHGGELVAIEAALAIKDDPGSLDRWEALFHALAPRGELAMAWQGLALATDGGLAPADAWCALVATMLANGEAELALGAASDGARRAEADPALWAVVGMLAVEAGQLTRAASALDTALAAIPASPLAWAARARLALATGHESLAAYAAGHALALGAPPDELDVLLGAGRTLDVLRMISTRTQA